MDRHLLDSCPSAVVDCPFKHAGCGVRGPRVGVEKHVDLDAKAHLKLVCGLVKTQRREIEDLRAQMESMTRSADGTLLWRISHFSRLLQEARLSPNTSSEVCSVPFYTHKYGYKLVASVFPNGDGEGAEGKYLSLYVKILPGDYDNLLEWPFPHPIKFTLIDQSAHHQRIINDHNNNPNHRRKSVVDSVVDHQHLHRDPTSTSVASSSSAVSPVASEDGEATMNTTTTTSSTTKKKHHHHHHHRYSSQDDQQHLHDTQSPPPHPHRQNVEERFDPDPNWKTFQKPRRENTASDCLGYGYPKFVAHETLLSKKKGFVYDDAIFVKIEIETHSIIKT